MLIHVFCLLISHCYLCLNNANQHLEKCTIDEPCSFQSSFLNSSLSTCTHFVITDSTIPKNSTSLFANILLYCASHQIKLMGLNQTIDMLNFPIDFKENANLTISNFTFINIKSCFMNSSNIRMNCTNITFARSKAQLFELEKSHCYFQSCQFNYNYVNNYFLVKFKDSIVTFSNCSVQAISQFPKSNFPIIYLENTTFNSINCHFYANYANHALFESNFSHLLIDNSSFLRNGGNFLLRSLNHSIIQFKLCHFSENSWKILFSSNSTFSIMNSSILRNCVSEPIYTFLHSNASFRTIQFIQNSCGAIIQSNYSSLSIIESIFSNNNSPTDIISVTSTTIDVKSTLFNNSLTSYGSSISSYYSHLLITNTSFNFTYSRTCGSSIFSMGSKLEGTSLFFLNTSSLSKSYSICMYDCKQSPFLISQSNFNNSQKNNLLSIHADQCPGMIQDSIFSREIEYEIPLTLFQKCTNCTFGRPIKIENVVLTPVIIYDFDKEIEMIIIGVISFVLLLILCFCFRRKIRMCFNRMTRKRHY